MCVVKTELKFSYYKDCLFNYSGILKSQQRFKSELHNVYFEEVNKIVFSSNDILMNNSYSRSSIQNTCCRWFWIRKNKLVIKFNKQPAR